MVARQRRDLLRVVGDEDRPPQFGFGGLLVQLQDQLAGAVVVLDRDVPLRAHPHQLVAGRVEVDGQAAVLGQQLQQGGPPPRHRQVQFPAVVLQRGGTAHLHGQVGHQLLDQLHDVGVVGVRLVQLEHRELGVVTGRQTLVAEHPGDLEHPLEAAHGEPLEVQLGGDPQVEVQVECVVVGGERSSQGPTGDGVEHRRLHLHEGPVLQPSTGGRHDPAAGREGGPGLVGHPQVDVALAEPGVHVGDAVPLVGEPPSGLGQADPRVDPDAQLAAAGLEHLAGHTDPVAQVQAGEALEVGGGPLQGEQLDPPGGVLEVAEGQLPLVATQHEAPGHADHHAGLLAVGQAAVGGLHGRRGGRRIEPVGNRAGRHVGGRVAHRLRSWTRRRPCRVRNGSTCSMVDVDGAIRWASPPVATTVQPPNSLRNRSTMPSIWAAKP